MSLESSKVRSWLVSARKSLLDQKEFQAIKVFASVLNIVQVNLTVLSNHLWMIFCIRGIVRRGYTLDLIDIQLPKIYDYCTQGPTHVKTIRNYAFGRSFACFPCLLYFLRVLKLDLLFLAKKLSVKHTTAYIPSR